MVTVKVQKWNRNHYKVTIELDGVIWGIGEYEFSQIMWQAIPQFIADNFPKEEKFEVLIADMTEDDNES